MSAPLITPDVPGRGLWRPKGGLLPATPGSKLPGAYYRLAAAGETPVGSAYARRTDLSDSARSVHLGVRAIQKLAGLGGADVDGWFGPKTAAAVLAAQKRLGVITDSVVGPRTMRAILEPLLRRIALHYGVPLEYLGGIVVHESQCDPAAVGVNGYDHGLAQINLDSMAHGGIISIEDAIDPSFAITWTAQTMHSVHDLWVGRTKNVDPWVVAILNHNSPRNALRLATSGAYPNKQAGGYVAGVLDAW